MLYKVILWSSGFLPALGKFDEWVGQCLCRTDILSLASISMGEPHAGISDPEIINPCHYSSIPVTNL